jgi:hypothetical protein
LSLHIVPLQGARALLGVLQESAALLSALGAPARVDDAAAARAAVEADLVSATGDRSASSLCLPPDFQRAGAISRSCHQLWQPALRMQRPIVAATRHGSITKEQTASSDGHACNRLS